jgi:hypothetical protein
MPESKGGELAIGRTGAVPGGMPTTGRLAAKLIARGSARSILACTAGGRTGSAVLR